MYGADSEAIIKIFGHRLESVNYVETEIKKISLNMTAREGISKTAEQQKWDIKQPEIVKENAPEATVIPQKIVEIRKK